MLTFTKILLLFILTSSYAHFVSSFILLVCVLYLIVFCLSNADDVWLFFVWIERFTTTTPPPNQPPNGVNGINNKLAERGCT
jgi:hypothetical protein